MQGTSANCSKVALACSGTLLVGLASDGVDAQPNVLQVWDLFFLKIWLFILIFQDLGCEYWQTSSINSSNKMCHIYFK